jgi:serpin B
MNKKWYNAEVQSLPFDQAAVDKINKWCANNTNNKIPKILDVIPSDAVMYLINAVYFKGKWKFEFDKADTRDEEFNLSVGGKKSVKMMTQEADLPYYGDGTLQCVDLPYGNGAFSMMVVMPSDENGSLDDLIASLDADKYNKAVDGLNERGVLLKLPRWKQECEFKLVDAVANLGMESILDPYALPLDGIAADPDPLYVSGIRQKTFVEVAEEGTEAVAVTIVEVTAATSVGPGGPVPFIADRPFLYLIRERSTGAILFIGRMDDPNFS